MEKKGYLPIFIAVAVLVTVLVLIFLPDKMFQSKNMKNINGQNALDDLQVLTITEQDGNYCKFNTVFGGTDYDNEVSSYISEYDMTKYNEDIDFIKSCDLSSMFNTNSNDEKDYAVVDTDAVVDTLKAGKSVNIVKDAVCVAVVDNYYTVVKLGSSSTYIIIDDTDTWFSKTYFSKQLRHIGTPVYTTIDADSCYITENAGSTFIFRGIEDETK